MRESSASSASAYLTACVSVCACRVWSLSGDNVIGIWTAQGDCVKMVEHVQRILDVFACGDQVWIAQQSALLVYDDHATLIRQM